MAINKAFNPMINFSINDLDPGNNGVPKFLEQHTVKIAPQKEPDEFDTKLETPKHDVSIDEYDPNYFKCVARLYDEGIIAVDYEHVKYFSLFLQRFTDWEGPILIRGERGLGKELVANFIYRNGKRNDKVFLPLNCAAFPGTLIESEIFGFCKGTFTDAKKNTPGYLETANGGVLFLDEVDKLSLKAQGALMRYLETSQFLRIGGREILTSDIQILSATNKDIGELIEKDILLPDFVDRIHGIVFKLPGYGERSLEEKRALCKYFILSEMKKKGIETLEMTKHIFVHLSDSEYHGNIRGMKMMCKIMVHNRDIPDNDFTFFANNMFPADIDTRRDNNDYVERSPATRHLQVCLPQQHSAYKELLENKSHKEAINGIIQLFAREWAEHKLSLPEYSGMTEKEIAPHLNLKPPRFSQLLHGK